MACGTGREGRRLRAEAGDPGTPGLRSDSSQRHRGQRGWHGAGQCRRAPTDPDSVQLLPKLRLGQSSLGGDWWHNPAEGVGWRRLVGEGAQTQGGMIWNSHIQDLLLPISRNSILLQRPNRQILFPGNFYPFMWRIMCAMGTKATRKSQSRLRKKIQSFPCSVSGYFPRFHKQVLRSGKQHIEREMEGRRRKLDEKKRGVYGVIIQPPPKKPVFLLFLRLSRLSFPRMQIYSKISGGHDEDAAGLAGDGAKC